MSRRPLRSAPLFLVVFQLTGVAAAPEENLAAATRLWARIRYTHPWLGLREIDWDRAYVEAAPRIMAADSREKYAQALELMLSHLNDPATYVAENSGPGMPSPRDARFALVEGGIVVYDPGVGVSDESFLQLKPRLDAALAKPEVRALVVDARESPSFLRRWSDDLTTHSTRGVMLISRQWSGYPTTGAAGGFSRYSTSLKQSAAPDVKGSPGGTAKPIYIVASKLTNLPQSVVALQAAGKAAIILEGPHGFDAAVPQQYGDDQPFGIKTVVRTAELQYPDGACGFAGNLSVDSAGLDRALELARSAKIPPLPERPRECGARQFAEQAYPDMAYPDEGHRLLAAARVWSVFDYFFPYKHLIGEDWSAVLPGALKEFRAAANAEEYHSAVARLVARTNDSHVGITSRHWTASGGRSGPPFRLRWVEGKPVVTQVLPDAAAAGVERGDVLVEFDGKPFETRLAELRPLVAASTEQSKMMKLLAIAANGPEGSSMKAVVEGVKGRREVAVPRRTSYQGALQYDREGPAFRKLDASIGYVDLPRLDPAKVDEMFDELNGTAAIVLDMRGYPRGTACPSLPGSRRRTSRSTPSSAGT